MISARALLGAVVLQKTAARRKRLGTALADDAVLTKLSKLHKKNTTN